MSLFDRKRKDDRADAPASSSTTGSALPGAAPSVSSNPTPQQRKTGEVSKTMANIGKSITIKGDLSGNEDLVIEGQVEGKIELPSNQLTIGAEGNASAEIHAQKVVVIGKVTGNVSATERIEIQASGFVDGDVKAPRLVVEEGAVLNGAIAMENPGGTSRPPASKPDAAPDPAKGKPPV